jgi:hypothetical protein
MSKDKDKDEVSNFINYSEKVFILSDNDANISHDIPFKNHYSGVIKIYISIPFYTTPKSIPIISDSSSTS